MFCVIFHQKQNNTILNVSRSHWKTSARIIHIWTNGVTLVFQRLSRFRETRFIISIVTAKRHRTIEKINAFTNYNISPTSTCCPRKVSTRTRKTMRQKEKRSKYNGRSRKTQSSCPRKWISAGLIALEPSSCENKNKPRWFTDCEYNSRFPGVMKYERFGSGRKKRTRWKGKEKAIALGTSSMGIV